MLKYIQKCRLLLNYCGIQAELATATQVLSGVAFLPAPTPVGCTYPCKYSLQSTDQEVWAGVSDKFSRPSCNLHQLHPHQIFQCIWPWLNPLVRHVHDLWWSAWSACSAYPAISSAVPSEVGVRWPGKSTTLAITAASACACTLLSCMYTFNKAQWAVFHKKRLSSPFPPSCTSSCSHKQGGAGHSSPVFALNSII